MQIVKSTGEKTEYDPDKIRRTIERTGADRSVADRVVERTSRRVRSGMTTKEIYKMVRRELKKEGRAVAQRYGLRSALLKMGPAGFKFEKYVSSILNAYQYDAHVPEQEFSGLCVNHELDVVAEKDGRRIFIEAKFRNKFGDSVNLKDTMATWARYVDLCGGAKAGKCPNFDEAWIVTNGRFSDRALQFGTCKGMHMVGWSEPEHSLARMVDHASLYPITVLDNVRQWELDKLADKNIMLCREVAELTPEKLSRRSGLPQNRSKKLIQDCSEVVTL